MSVVSGANVKNIKTSKVDIQKKVPIADGSLDILLLGEIIEHAPTDQLFLNPREEKTAMYIEGRYG